MSRGPVNAAAPPDGCIAVSYDWHPLFRRNCTWNVVCSPSGETERILLAHARYRERMSPAGLLAQLRAGRPAVMEYPVE